MLSLQLRSKYYFYSILLLVWLQVNKCIRICLFELHGSYINMESVYTVHSWRQYIRDTVQLYDIGQIIQQVVLVCQNLADVT